MAKADSEKPAYPTVEAGGLAAGCFSVKSLEEAFRARALRLPLGDSPTREDCGCPLTWLLWIYWRRGRAGRRGLDAGPGRM